MYLFYLQNNFDGIVSCYMVKGVSVSATVPPPHHLFLLYVTSARG